MNYAYRTVEGTKDCPVCENKIEAHTVQNFMDCIEKFINQWEYPNCIDLVDREGKKIREVLVIVHYFLYESPYLARYKDYLTTKIMIKGQGNPEDLLKVLKDFFVELL